MDFPSDTGLLIGLGLPIPTSIATFCEPSRNYVTVCWKDTPRSTEVVPCLLFVRKQW